MISAITEHLDGMKVAKARDGGGHLAHFQSVITDIAAHAVEWVVFGQVRAPI
jgi:hypothetical protein